MITTINIGNYLLKVNTYSKICEQNTINRKPGFTRNLLKLEIGARKIRSFSMFSSHFLHIREVN